MAVVLNQGKIGGRLGRKAFLGIQQESGVNHDIPSRSGLRNQGTRCQLKIGCVLDTVDINDRTTLAIHPIRVVVLVVVIQTITPLGDPNHTCDQIMKGKLNIRGSLLTFLGNPLDLLNQEALIRRRNLGTFAFRQVDVVGLDIRIGKPVGE